MTTIPLPSWLWHVWPTHSERYAVMADYAAIGAQHHHFLADLALRAGVYRNFHPASDRTLEHFNGRRELALEVIKLCKVDPNVLFASIPTAKPAKEEKA